MIEIFAATAFPAAFRGICVADRSRAIIRSGYYEPLWPLWAEILWNFSSESRELMRKQLELSDPDYLAAMANRRPALSRILKKKSSQEKEQNYRLITNKGEKNISFDDYSEWQQIPESGILKIDMVAGIISHGSKKIKTNPDTVPFRILKALLKSATKPVSCHELHSVIWGGTYDHEIDWPVMKTSISRIRKLVRKVFPIFEITACGRQNSISLKVDYYFEAVL